MPAPKRGGRTIARLPRFRIGRVACPRWTGVRFGAPAFQDLPHGAPARVWYPRGVISTGENVGGARPILVVEDDDDTVAALRMLLDDAGYPSVSAGDATSAIALLRQADPGLVLLDWSLDEGTGEEVLLAARDGARRPPVVLVTGYSEIGRCPSPPDAVLHKPFDVEELLQVIARHYRR